MIVPDAFDRLADRLEKRWWGRILIILTFPFWPLIYLVGFTLPFVFHWFVGGTDRLKKKGYIP